MVSSKVWLERRADAAHAHDFHVAQMKAVKEYANVVGAENPGRAPMLF
jgi:hypothetical protein